MDCARRAQLLDADERRTYGYNCKICSHKVLIASVNDFATTDVLLATELHPSRNGTPATAMCAATELFWWRYRAGNHEYEQSVPNRRKTRGCPKCPPYLRILVSNN